MLDQWPRQFPGCPPIAHQLRTAFPDRWVRFHSLPESKRYPEDEAEYATVLHRHTRILDELTRTEREVVLLTTGYSDTPEPIRQPELPLLNPGANLWRTLPIHELDQWFDTPTYWHLFAGITEWQPGLFDPLIRLVAVDAISNVMIVNPECRWLLHPYDGGMDVILESPAARDRLKSAHPDWLSRHPAGL
jgi:hypothetical protein